MNVGELIEALLKVDPALPVYKSDSSGCSECNPYGISYETEVYSTEVVSVGSGWPRRSRTALVL